MPRRSVSPRFVDFVSIPVAGFLTFAFLAIEHRHFPSLRLEQALPPFPFAIWWFSARCVVPLALRCFGIIVRTRSVERLGGGKPGAASAASTMSPKPESMVRLERPMIGFRVLGIVLFPVGLPAVMIALVIAPIGLSVGWVCTIVFLILGVLLIASGVYLNRCPPFLLCEIDDRGICAPCDLLGSLRFLPWTSVTGCEIIRDDPQWPDYFVVEDRLGRPLFGRSKHWMRQVSRPDRERIFAALRSRLPRTDKPTAGPTPALAGAGASGVWDRELDG
ncbi:MAG: hypothetical protein ACYC61_26055 [Isosphaeraceae bacterium]